MLRFENLNIKISKTSQKNKYFISKYKKNFYHLAQSTLCILIWPYTWPLSLHLQQLKLALTQPGPDGPLGLATRGQADVALLIDVDRQAERVTVDATGRELEVV